MLLSILAICLGACLGALLRWLLSLALNPLLAALPLGTLAANWTGSFIMGLAVAFFASRPEIPQQWKLLAITGFLGSLTTFSAFAAEMAAMLQEARPLACLLAIALHVGGSITLVFAGMAAFACMKKFLA